MENRAVAHTNSVVDSRIISEIFKCRTDKTLLWDGFKKDSKGKDIKNQYWINAAVQFELHIKGIKKQGGCLNRNGVANCAVVDVDKEIDAKEICREAYRIDPLIIMFKSPSGRWHAWKFYHEDQDVKTVITDIKRIEKEFIKLYSDKVDRDKTQPTPGGLTGINFPFSSDEQYPYSPQGHRLSWKKFLFKYRFQHHPLVAIAAGLTEPGRHKTLCLIAAYLEKKSMFQHLDDVVDALDNFTDTGYVRRIKEDKIHEKYDVGPDAIQIRIAEIVGHEEPIIKIYNEETGKNEFIDFEDDVTAPAVEDPPIPEPNLKEVIDELELFEHTGLEKIKPRPWLLSGWLLEKALTLIVGQPGVGKTMLMHMIAYALVTGNPIFGKDILKRGNALIVAAEETLNEIDIRLTAARMKMGKNDGRFKIYKRGLEQDLKLVKFTKDAAIKTKQYLQLEKTIKSKNIKYIILDPLINFQSGNYNENDNQNMDAYVKQFLIPLAVNMKGAVIAGHHTNKISMVSTQDSELLVDNQNALMAARGASSLIGAARFVLALQPMTKKLWDTHFKQHIKDGSNFVHYTGLIEAKSNYNMIADEISWLKKDTIQVPTDDGFTESTGVYATTDLNKITKAKNRLKAAENLAWCKNYALSTVQKLFNAVPDEIDSITLNSVVLELVPNEDDFGDGNVAESKIKTRIRRKLQNGFGGKVETKDGFQTEGIAADDGYNYWLKRDHTRAGAAKEFITRYVDFKKRNAAR